MDNAESENVLRYQTMTDDDCEDDGDYVDEYNYVVDDSDNG